MSSRSLALATLRQNPGLEGTLTSWQARPRLNFTDPEAPGVERGGLTHLDGPARVEAVVRLLALHPQWKCAWIEETLSAYPPGFAQRGVRLENLLFVEAGAHFVWALTEAVRGQVFPLVAAASGLPDALALRRLQLAAERAGCAVLLAAPLPPEAWPVRTRLWCGWRGATLTVSEAAMPKPIFKAAP